MHLTQADRTAVLGNLCGLADGWAGDDAGLIAAVTHWAACIRPTFGFEHGLGRDVFLLCDTLRRAGRSREAAELARGGPVYLHRSNIAGHSPLGPLGLLDDAFLAGYAAHSIREKLGESSMFSPPQLTREERDKAEELFLELLDRPEDDSEGLVAQAWDSVSRLGCLLDSGIFSRLRMNLRFLVSVLADHGRPADQRQIASAGLRYVAEEDDIIPDRLGLIGFLDDYFIAELACSLIEPGRSPWLGLIDATVGAWPFLNMVCFQGEHGGSTISEFMLVNAAIICPAVRGPQERMVTQLILPRTGPTPLLLAFFASLGLLWKERIEHGQSLPFHAGQKVRVDGKSVRIFAGCKDSEGRMMFGLERSRRIRVSGARYEQEKTIEWWPMEQLYRLQPAESDRVARGRISLSAGGGEMLGALDYLFLSPEPITFRANLPQIIVVTPVGAARQVAEGVKIYGQSLSEIIPLASLNSAGEPSNWSDRFGNSRPGVLVIPDLDRACEYLEVNAKDVALTVVDASGHNAERTASLSRLPGLGGRILIVSPEADADELMAEEVEVATWDWRPSDLELLCWDPCRPGGDEPIRRYERDMARALTATTEVVRVKAPCIEEAFQAIDSLRVVIEARGEDHPPDLDRALEVGYSSLIRLFRFPFRLEDHPRFVADISARLGRMSIGPSSRVFLTSEECQAIGRAGSGLQDLFSRLMDHNPKAEALEDLTRSNPGLVVLCGDVDLAERVEGLAVRPIAAIRDWTEEREVLRGGLVPGWFNRRQMRRVLRPPFSSPLYLLLNDVEYGWYRAFDRHVSGGLAARSRRTARSQLFPVVTGWVEPGENGRPDHPVEEPAVPTRITEEAETAILRACRRRLSADARASAGEAFVDARLVMFAGGSHAFLADAYRAKVATHLLVPVSGRGPAELEVIAARQLKCGDALLFLRGSERDVIRSVADGLLPSGERERAGLWRRALLKFREATSSSIEDVWARLRDLGCPLGLPAIRNWFLDDEIISPISAERELKTISDLTRDPALVENLRGCLDSISRVRGAHLRASRRLAQRVIDQAVKGLGSASPDAGPIEVEEGVILVKISEIDEEYVRVRCSAANRLVEA